MSNHDPLRRNLLAGASALATASCTGMTTSAGPVENGAASLCRSYLESFAKGDPDAIAAHVAPDFVNEHTAALASGSRGAAEYRRRLPGFLASLPGLSYDIEELIAQSDRVFAAYTLRAQVNSRPIALRGVMRFQVRAGRIVHRIDYWDSLAFQRQAGLA